MSSPQSDKSRTSQDIGQESQVAFTRKAGPPIDDKCDIAGIEWDNLTFGPSKEVILEDISLDGEISLDIDSPIPLSFSPENKHIPPINVPLGRSIELDRDIQHYTSQLSQIRETIRILEKQIADLGGDAFAPSSLIIQKRNEEKKEKNLKQITNALISERYLQNSYEVELCAFAILRSELAIATGNDNIRNADVLALADKVYPNIFNEHSVLLGLVPPLLASKFQSVEIIDSKITQLETFSHPDVKLLQQYQSYLNAAKQAKLAQEEFSDSSSLLSQIDVDLPRFSDEVASRVDIKLDQDWYLRISVIRMPSVKGQEVNDAIVLHESYPPDTLAMVHIAITYYRPWGLGQFKLSNNPDLMNTLGQIKEPLCKVCNAPLQATSAYRLPSCILFLRFYDQTDQFEDRLKGNKLFHTPFCRALQSGVLTNDYEIVINEVYQLRNCSIPDWIFGELFKRQMLGSNWIKDKDLRGIYNILRSNIPEKVGFVIHSQIYKKEG